ncbi:MAG: nitrogen regulation protein NR(II) [Halieaceae bacterium]
MPTSDHILESLSTGVIALDSELRLTAINAAAQNLLQVSEARSLGLSAQELLPRSREWISAIRQAQTDSMPVTRRNLVLVLPNHQEMHVDLFIAPLFPEQGGPGLLVELQTVDRLLRISREESILNAQATTRAVIRGLAHEIKNPLGGVRGAAQLLERELPEERLNEYTGIIIQEADRLRDLVDRLLGSHKELSLQPVNVHEVLEHVRNLLSAESGPVLTFDRDYDPSLPEVPGDKTQLIQAVLNITGNAVQAATDIADCHITLRTRSQRQFTIGTKRHRLVCRIDIIDNGPGIPEDLQHSIFVPMVTGRADGTGLGLSISQSIINRHGGLVECASEPGETRFSIYLPMETNHAENS